MKMKTASVLTAGILTAATAAVVELPVRIEDGYASVQLSIGTPPRPYRLLFDSGSSTTWITSTSCTSTSCPNPRPYNRTLYAANASSTSTDLHSSSRIPYIDGDGVAGAATLDVFSTPDAALQWNQTFLSANESSWRWITADGFLGLGFSSIAENGTSSLVETLLWGGYLDAPRVGLFYGTNLADAGPQNGILSIGGSAEEKYVEGEIVYAPLRRESPYQLWRAPLRSVNILVARDLNTSLSLRTGSLPTIPNPVPGTWPRANTTWSMYGAGTAVFDTGAGRVSVPREIASALYYNLGWNLTKLYSGEERMGCSHMNASWALSFTLGDAAATGDDVTFSLRGDEFLEPGKECMPPFDDSGESSFALLGSAFLQRYYSVFDFGGVSVGEYEPRVGFGRLKGEWDYLYQ